MQERAHLDLRKPAEKVKGDMVQLVGVSHPGPAKTAQFRATGAGAGSGGDSNPD
jgi:hypothetical protein